MAVVYTASLELRFRTFWDQDTDSPTSDRELDYLVKQSTYPSVERVKAAIDFGWSTASWYAFECFDDRRYCFYRSCWLDLSSLQHFRWKVISPTRRPIRRLFLVCSAYRRGRRMEGRIRLDFGLASARIPILYLDGSNPSWSAKRSLLLSRVLGSLKVPSAVISRSFL
jgi:hypothetical protein